MASSFLTIYDDIKTHLLSNEQIGKGVSGVASFITTDEQLQ